MQTTTTRARRAPRLAIQAIDLCRRLHKPLKAAYLSWLMCDLGKQLDAIEAKQADAMHTALLAAQQNRYSPRLNTFRRDLRRQHDLLTARLAAVRGELDALQVLA